MVVKGYLGHLLSRLSTIMHKASKANTKHSKKIMSIKSPKLFPFVLYINVSRPTKKPSITSTSDTKFLFIMVISLLLY